MEIKARISNEFEKIELHVCNHAMTDEVKGILSELHEIYDLQLTATDSKGDRVLLRPGDVVYFSASGQKVFAGTAEGVYTVNEKLYELEEALKQSRFVRISKSESVIYFLVTSAVCVSITIVLWQLHKYPIGLICALIGYGITHVIIISIEYRRLKKDILLINEQCA